VPIIVRGDGCYLEDANGKRYLDALAGLFAVQIGYSYGEEVGEAAAAQMRELPFYTNWSYAHPRAIELAAEVAKLECSTLTAEENLSLVASAAAEERSHVSVAGGEHGGEARGFFFTPAAFAGLFEMPMVANNLQSAFAVNLLFETPQGFIN
jgi:hypothetical protein